jgi:TIR domain
MRTTLRGALEQTIFKSVREQIQAKLMGIRDPKTGEFPSVVVRGRDWNHLSLEVSGSEQVVALAKERLGIYDANSETNGDAESSAHSKESKSLPCVSLCHASENKPLARNIAEHLLKYSVNTFFDQWEIGPGDSIRQKIDTGLAECTHFLVLLTPQSLSKPWVNTEIDAGFIRKIEGQCKFIPLRYDLSVDALPPLLKTLYSPELRDQESDLKTLVSFIDGISEKPPLGPPPQAIARPIGSVRRRGEHSPLHCGKI